MDNTKTPKTKQKQYQKKVTNNPCLKLPSLEIILTQTKALKIKNYFLYQLVKKRFSTSILCWRGGGFAHIYTQSAVIKRGA